MSTVISIAIGAILGAFLRWQLGEHINPVFPTLPLGTLTANLLGSFLMGATVFFTTEHTYFSDEVRLGIITGFLGSLTTFSTFSSEALLLLSKSEILWFLLLIGIHVGGSICLVAAGYLISKFFMQSIGG